MNWSTCPCPVPPRPALCPRQHYLLSVSEGFFAASTVLYKWGWAAVCALVCLLSLDSTVLRSTHIDAWCPHVALYVRVLLPRVHVPHVIYPVAW